MSVNLGRVAFVAKGSYNAATTYQQYDYVTHNNGSYVYISPIPAAGKPVTDAGYWQPLIDPEGMNDATAAANAAATQAQTNAQTAATAAETANTAAAAADEARQNIQSDLAGKAPAIYVAASGDLVHVTDGAAMPVKSLITRIAPVQEGEGDPSPYNVRPIRGWDKVSAYRTGKNLVPNNWVAGSLGGNNGIMVEINNDSGVQRQTNIFLKAGTYTISGPEKAFVYITDANRNINQSVSAISGVYTPYTFTISNDSYMSLIAAAAYVDGDINNIKYQVECGSTATPYEPYQGQTLTADLPETVYGGALDWGTGVLTVDWKMVNLGDYNWTYYSPGKVFYNNTILSEADGYPANAMMCTAYKTSVATQVEIMENLSVWSRWVALSVKNICIKNTAYTDPATLKASLAGVMLAFKTKAPYTIQLTPQQLSTLKGINNVWSDAGATEVTYVADTKLYADGKDSTAMIGTAEPGMIATKNYASGDFIVVGKSLYKATAAIATGEAITPGTNCTATTVIEQLEAIYNLIKQ